MKNDEFTPFYAVWTKPSSQESRRPIRRTFDNLADAQAACEQMAKKHPSRKFFVMQAVERVVFDPLAEARPTLQKTTLQGDSA